MRVSQSEKLIIILNGVSRHKKKFYRNILPALSANFQVDVWETRHAEHGIELGIEAAKQNPYGVLAAGGDGTLNQVLNGLFQSNLNVLPPLGIIPLGTGNDFARLASVEPTGQSVLNKVQSSPQLTDVGMVACVHKNGTPTTRYFINVASLGMGPAVVHELVKSNRTLGRDLTYLISILKVFFTHKLDEIEVKTNHWVWRSKARVVAIANGQSFGGGIFIAPQAQPNDGVFSTFVAGDVPVLKFLQVLQQVKAKKLVRHSALEYNSATQLHVSSPHLCYIETEGELAGLLPASINILPKAIHFFR